MTLLAFKPKFNTFNSCTFLLIPASRKRKRLPRFTTFVCVPRFTTFVRVSPLIQRENVVTKHIERAVLAVLRGSPRGSLARLGRTYPRGLLRDHRRLPRGAALIRAREASTDSGPKSFTARLARASSPLESWSGNAFARPGRPTASRAGSISAPPVVFPARKSAAKHVVSESEMVLQVSGLQEYADMPRSQSGLL